MATTLAEARQPSPAVAASPPTPLVRPDAGPAPSAPPGVAADAAAHAQGLAGMAAAFEAVALHVDRTAGGFLEGRLRDVVLEHLATGGKRVRARITLQAGSALGVSPAALVPFAAACELLHNASLVHDDLQDGDRVRRGHPAVWAAHGEDMAIMAGDALLMLPMLALEVSPSPPDVRWAQCRALAHRAAQTACGQVHELELPKRFDADWSAYLTAAMGKSGPFFALPVEGAVLAAGHPVMQARRVGDALLALGVIFQLRDDVLDLYGDDYKGRRAVGNDLREGKVSALVVAHLEACPADREALFAVLETPREQTSAAAVGEWSRRFVRSGALDRVAQVAGALLDDLGVHPALVELPALRDVVVALAASLVKPLEDAVAR